MRTAFALLLLSALTASATAQSSDSVTVNSAGQILIDPATGQQRVVPPLLQPWQNETVRLRPPGKHRPRAVQETTPGTAATPPPAAVASAPAVRKPQPVRRVAVVAPPKPATPQQPAPQTPAPGGADDFSGLLSRSQTNVLSNQTASTPPPAPHRTVTAPAPKPPTRTASIERPNPAATAGKRRDMITFARGATDPSSGAIAAVRALAGTLNAALTDSASRIQLLAYAGQKGEKSSDTRRLSLRRAIVVRQLLIDDGVPAERIDVFALGGVEDNGPLDRVDVYVKS